jgi:hypothetical protein
VAQAALLRAITTRRHWVETLVAGARMLSATAANAIAPDDVEGGMADVCEAGRLVVLERTRLDADESDLVAAVDLTEGVWNMVMIMVFQRTVVWARAGGKSSVADPSTTKPQTRPQPGQHLVHRTLASLLRQRCTFQLHISWVPGHQGVEGNEAVDETSGKISKLGRSFARSRDYDAMGADVSRLVLPPTDLDLVSLT